MAYPRKHGLYNPKYERDACGIGFVVNIKGGKSNQIVKMALESLVCLDHRGGARCRRQHGRRRWHFDANSSSIL